MVKIGTVSHHHPQNLMSKFDYFCQFFMQFFLLFLHLTRGRGASFFFVIWIYYGKVNLKIFSELLGNELKLCERGHFTNDPLLHSNETFGKSSLTENTSFVNFLSKACFLV